MTSGGWLWYATRVSNEGEPDITLQPVEPAPLPPALPYESAAPVGTFYRVDSSRASFGELLRDAGASTVWLVWITKLLRVKLPGSVNDPNVQSLAPFETDPATLPPEVVARITPTVEQLRSRGFTPVAWYSIVDLFHASRLHFALLSHTSGSGLARVAFRTEGTSVPPKSHFHVEFITELADGRFLWSTSAKAYLDAPRECVLNAQPKMEPALLWTTHQQRLDTLRVDQRVAAVRNPADPRELLERHHAVVRDDRLRRRLFAPMSRDELERAAAVDQYRVGAATGQLREADVLAELDKLQNRKASWTTTVLILAVSLVLFFRVGTDSWLRDREFLLMIVGILFFHEMGHYITMRMFHYRNLRMFFIPMVGAAVSGQHYNVPGWKKVIVALAGPLPGIVLGGALGIAGIVHGYNPLMLKTAVAALLLNGLNLLPVLPLDGGRVVHAMLFSRHPALDITFRIAAAVLLILGSLAPGGRFFMFLGIATLISVPAAYRTARIAHELRLAGLPSVSPDSQTIPIDIAQVIIDRVRQAFPAKTGNKMIAQHTLNVYETINARPPGWPATIGFGAVHGGAFVVSLIMVAVFVFAQQPGGLSRGGFARMASRAAMTPKTALDPSAIRTAGIAPTDSPAATTQLVDDLAIYRPRSADAPPRPYVLVAQFDNRAAAEATFAAAEATLPQRAGALLFGQMVLLTLPADAGDDARRAWLDFLESRSKQVSVDRELGPTFKFHCTAPSEAAAIEIEKELSGYFNVLANGQHLVPPWHPNDPRSPQERQRNDAARRTFLRLQEATATAFKVDGSVGGGDPRLAELNKSITNATRRGEAGELKKLRAQRDAIFTELRNKAIAGVRAQSDSDPAVVDLFASQYEHVSDRYDREWYQQYERNLAKLFGQLPMPRAATRPTVSATRYSANGSITREGAALNFMFVSFSDSFTGPPVLVRWLVGKGCRDFKYSVEHYNYEPSSYEGDPDEDL